MHKHLGLQKGQIMKNFLNLLWMASLGFVSSSCTSVPPTREGLQSEFLALNPARIAAFPPMVMAHPVEKTSIDPAAVVTSQVQSLIESEILAAFKNQPNVNGVSFQTVRNSLKTAPRLAGDIDSELKSMGQLTNSGSARETLLLTRECRSQKSFLGFYKHCVNQSNKWTSLLNQFSAAVQNSDSILLPILTSLEKTTEKNAYVVRVGVTLLLIDTNSGKLIWGRDSIMRAETPSGVRQFAEVNVLLDKIFVESFWSEFPGRRARSEQNN